MKNKRWLLFVFGFVIASAVSALSCLGLVSLGVITRDLMREKPIPFGDAVGVIYIEGPIVVGESPSRFGSGIAFAETIIAHLRAASEDDAIRAIVLRVDSPGGSVVASREIYDAVRAVQARGKPVVVSMGEVAASGGYYVSASAEKILVEAGTLTGSIGVISAWPSLEGLREKIGVKMIVVKSGPHKDASFGFRDLTTEEREIWQALIDDVYEDFVNVVVEGRKLDVAQVKALADGRVYTGKQAKEKGLADAIGDLDAAVDAAAKLANIPGKPRVIKFRYTPDILESFAMTTSRAFAPPDLLQLFGLERWGRPLYLYVAP